MSTTTSHFKCRPAARDPLRGRARRAHTRGRGRAADAAFRSGVAAPRLDYTESALLPALPQAGGLLRPRILHVDADRAASLTLAGLVAPDADLVHAGSLAQARRLLAGGVYSLLVLDPALPDGDARSLLPLLAGTPLLLYAVHQPEWRGAAPAFLSKPWTELRQLWSTISTMLGLCAGASAGA